MDQKEIPGDFILDWLKDLGVLPHSAKTALIEAHEGSKLVSIYFSEHNTLDVLGELALKDFQWPSPTI